MDKHQKRAAELCLVSSGFIFLLGLLMLSGYECAMEGFIDGFMKNGFDRDMALSVFWRVVGVWAVVMLLKGGEIVAALLFLRGSQPARHALMAFAVLGLFSVPLGTALSLYTLWALGRRTTERVPAGVLA